MIDLCWPGYDRAVDANTAFRIARQVLSDEPAPDTPAEEETPDA